MAVLCPEKLPQCDLPQLASCLQRLSADVLDHHQHHLVEAVGGDRVSVPGDCLPLPRPGPQVQTVQLSKYFLISKYFPGPQGDQQQLPDQVQQQPRQTLLYLNHGAPPL